MNPLSAASPKLGTSAIAFSRPYFGDAEATAAAAAVRSGWVVGGPRLAEFEERFAAACGARHAVGVSSWTTGAFLVLHAWGIGPGDEVIVPSLTFIASVNVIRHVGATPVFADVDSATYNIDPADAAEKITPRTRAIMPVDQLGLPCHMDAFNALAQRHGLHVLDDAACAFTSAISELRITVETMDPPHSEYMKQAEQCGADTTPLKAIGNEAVVCSPNARAARVVGRVRNRIFTILITTTDSSTASDLLREKAHAVAEQVAGILF